MLAWMPACVFVVCPTCVPSLTVLSVCSVCLLMSIPVIITRRILIWSRQTPIRPIAPRVQKHVPSSWKLWCRPETVFYISYVGRSIYDDSEQLPSVLVSELSDYLRRYGVGGRGASLAVPTSLATVFPVVIFKNPTPYTVTLMNRRRRHAPWPPSPIPLLQ